MHAKLRNLQITLVRREEGRERESGSMEGWHHPANRKEEC